MISRHNVLSALVTCTVSAVASAFGPILPSPILPAGADAARGLALRLPSGVSPVQVDANLVSALPKDGTFTLIGFPLEDGRLVDLELERFSPVREDAKILVGGLAADGSWMQEPGDFRPTVECFRGQIAGQPNSSAFLAFDALSTEGLIIDEAEGVHSLSDGGSEVQGPLVITKLRSLPPGLLAGSAIRCQTPSKVDANAQPFQQAERFMPPPDCLMLEMAIETDREYLKSFSANRTNALNAIAKLMGAMSTIYLNQLNVDAEAVFMRLWAATGTGYPYKDNYGSSSGTGLEGMLTDLNKRWSTSDTGVGRDVVAMLSTQNVGGGMAFGIGGVCEKGVKDITKLDVDDPTTSAAYCAFGSPTYAFPYPLQNQNASNGPVTTFLHEVGHVLGARHTHDFPADNYDDCIVDGRIGPCALRRQGTIMSYCHVCQDGEENINLSFTPRNLSQISTRLDQTSCVVACTGTGAPAGLAAGCTGTEVNLSWGAVTNAKGYVVYRFGSNDIVPKRFTTAAAVRTLDDTPDDGGTSYRYLVRALLTKGATPAPGTSDLFEGPASDVVTINFPAGPTDLDGDFDSSDSTVSLSWTASEGASSYNVYRGLGTDTPTLLTSTASTEYVDTLPVAPKRLGTYYVTAVNADGCESEPSDSILRGWGVIDLDVTYGTRADGVRLTWTEVPTATGYHILRKSGTSGIPIVEIDTAAAGDTSYIDTTAAVGTFYTYAMQADFGADLSDVGNRDVGWRNAEAPANFSCTDATLDNVIRATWDSVDGATGYVIYRKLGAGTFQKLATITGGATETYDDKTAYPDESYSFYICARTTAGDSLSPPVYSEASSTDAGSSSFGPPADVTATVGAFSTKVVVAFPLPVPGAIKYGYYRTAAGGSPVLLGMSKEKTFEDTTGSQAQAYTYSVTSIGSVTESPKSSGAAGWRAIGATSRVTASDGTSTSGVTITWNSVPLANGYVVRRSAPGVAYVDLATKSGGSSTSHTDTTATPGTLYAYAVVARYANPTNLALNVFSPVATSDSGWINLSAPKGVTATQGTSTALVEVRWNAAAGATMYQIERRTDTSSFQVIVPKREFTTRIYYDRTALPGKRYCYIVRAAGSAGMSAGSDAACGWRYKPGGPNPSTTGGGTGTGRPVADGGDGGAGQSSAAMRPWDAPEGSSEDAVLTDPAPLEQADPLEAAVPADDPAWQLDCRDASLEAMQEAVLAGSQDLDHDGRPDLCQHERGDLDLSGHVDAGDMVMLLLFFGDQVPPMGDFNHDGTVDRADLDHLEGLVAEQVELDALEASQPPELAAPAG